MKRSRKRRNKLKGISVRAVVSHLQSNTLDYVLFFAVFLLTAFGVVMVYNTGTVVAFEEFQDKYFFLTHQGIWAALGTVIALIVMTIDVKTWEVSAPLLLGIAVFLLILVFVPGMSAEVYGARQRIVVPGVNINLQPSEFAKLALVIYLAYLFARSKQKKKEFPNKQFIAVTALVVGLTAMEPDLGNAVLLMGTAILMYFAAGATIKQVFAVLGSAGILAFFYSSLASYRTSRISDFINIYLDPTNISYHIRQIFIALGSGGLFGIGLGQSRQKYKYIPEVTTDSIFAIFGEELGFVAALLLLMVFAFIIWRGLMIASSARNDFERLLALGITTNLAIQTIVNIGGLVGAMPFTGVPLPFISYGGSSLVFILLSIGILIRISTSSRNK